MGSGARVSGAALLVVAAGVALVDSGASALNMVLERDTDAYDEAIALDRILQAIEPAKQLRLVILDACRDNPFAKKMKRTVASRALGRGSRDWRTKAWVAGWWPSPDRSTNNQPLSPWGCTVTITGCPGGPGTTTVAPEPSSRPTPQLARTGA